MTDPAPPDPTPAERRRWLQWDRLALQLPLLATLATVVISGYNVLQSQAQYNQSQANTRFSDAITLLSNGNFNSRLGGIFVLSSIARSTSDNAFASGQVLAAYLRQQHAVTAASKAAAYTPGDAAEDVQAALVGLTLRADPARSLSLAGVDARNARLSEVGVQNLNFRSADLRGVNFSGSTLTGLQFTGTQLDRANFSGAVLKDVDFDQADVTGADFSGADLRGATHLTGAMLASATLSSATQQPAASAATSQSSAP